MRPIGYARPSTVDEALELRSSTPDARYLAGGTNLVDLMREGIAEPRALVDVTALPLREIHRIPSGPRRGGLSLGATEVNAVTANHPLVRAELPLVSRAVLAGASGQLRNMATNGGNLNQRTRCPYFYDVALPCNKRSPGAGCSALAGVNRNSAIFGWTDECVATHPSDLAVALSALDAVVRVRGIDGSEREVSIHDYHRLPGDSPELDTTLRDGDLVTAIEVPVEPVARSGTYVKVRDRPSYAFALVSVAAAVEVDDQGVVVDARIAMGGVAHKPWRARAAEAALVGRSATGAVFAEAAATEMATARPLEGNRAKVVPGARAIVRALRQAVTGVGR